jgi:carbonic anhydrase
VKKLLEGFIRYKSDVYPQHRELFQELALQQCPDTLFIGCSDSRMVPGVLLQTAPGDLFVCRNAGNIAPPHGEHAGGVSATIEYAVQVLGVQHIIVCGHSDCGALKAAMHPEKVVSLPAVSQWLRHTERAVAVVNATCKDCDDHEKLNLLVEENVLSQLDNLRTHPSVAAKLRSGGLELHGWVFNIPRAELKVYDAEQQSFVPMTMTADSLIPTGEALNV